MDNKNTNNQNNKTDQTDKNLDEFKEDIKKQGTEIGNTVNKFAADTGMFVLILFCIIC